MQFNLYYDLIETQDIVTKKIFILFKWDAKVRNLRNNEYVNIKIVLNRWVQKMFCIIDEMVMWFDCNSNFVYTQDDLCMYIVDWVSHKAQQLFRMCISISSLYVYMIFIEKFYERFCWIVSSVIIVALIYAFFTILLRPTVARIALD